MRSYVLAAALPVLCCTSAAYGLARAIAGPCMSDRDCSLLGVCTADGTCACDGGWKGHTCSAADLMPLNVSKGYHNASAASWGGRAVVDPATGLWHLFVAQFSHGCRVREWTHNSVVARAVSSEGPAGPYVYAEEVYPEFHHNPTVVGPTPDGYYLTFGTALSGSISTVLTVWSWISVGIHSLRALPCPVCA